METCLRQISSRLLPREIFEHVHEKNFEKMEQTYKRMTQEEHVLERPDVYVGSPLPTEFETMIFDGERMTTKTIYFSEALERIFLEVLSNAADNVVRSRREKVNPGSIEVTMNQEMIRVKNYGIPIPIKIHEEHGIYNPELIFGHMLTSSNYEGDRHGAGLNGIGAKATNIFSTYFSVYVEDATNHLSYRQGWWNNKTIKAEPTISVYEGVESSVTVEYVADLPRFGFKSFDGEHGGYTDDLFCLFFRHVVDVSLNLKVHVIFNGVEVDASDIRTYARMIYSDIADTGVIHYEWPVDTTVVKGPKGLQTSKDSSVLPLVEMIVLDTPNDGSAISFVNCMMTRDGGVHVNEAFSAVGEETLENVNSTLIKALEKSKADAAQVKKLRLTLTDLRKHVSMVLCYRTVNPRYNNQSKTSLKAPKPKIVIQPNELKVMSKWKFVEHLYLEMNMKQEMALSKTDGKKTRYVKIPKGFDANLAGGPESDKCALFLPEGDSGAGYVYTILSHVPNGGDVIGILPLRGKPLNTRDCNILQLQNNVEIQQFKTMMGLREGVDYRDPQNIATLRYGMIIGATDADVDGKHILGLLLNYLDVRFPGLLYHGVFRYLRTPIIRAFRGQLSLKFFSEQEHLQWRERDPEANKYDIKYYKGLGTSSPAEVAEDMQSPFYVEMVQDPEAAQSLKLAFDRGLCTERKHWILNTPKRLRAPVTREDITTFVHYDLIDYSRRNIERSIPNLMDGMKESQRKVIFFLAERSGSKSKEMKVAQVANGAANRTNYHYAEGNLEEVIIKMAQNFVGANNCPLLKANGQFGSRLRNGDDAASGRYIFTDLQPVFWQLFRKEDTPVLDYVVDEGEALEPVTYYPIIPWILVNGSIAIATGFSTFIPCHRPNDLIAWLIERLRGRPAEEMFSIEPWYRGFKGSIEVRQRGCEMSIEELAGELFEEDFQNPDIMDFFRLDKVKNSMVTQGSFEILSSKAGKFVVEITELPIGTSINRYRDWLDTLREEKAIKSYRYLSDANKVSFVIEGFKEQPTVKSLRLQRTYGISNMVVLDENKRPQIFQNANQLMEYFYQQRLPIYERRKAYDLQKILDNIEQVRQKKHLIELFLANRDRFLDRPKAEVLAFVQAEGIPSDIYSNMKLSGFTTDDITKREQQIVAFQGQYQQLEARSVKDIWLEELEQLQKCVRNV